MNILITIMKGLFVTTFLFVLCAALFVSAQWLLTISAIRPLTIIYFFFIWIITTIFFIVGEA